MKAESASHRMPTWKLIGIAFLMAYAILALAGCSSSSTGTADSSSASSTASSESAAMDPSNAQVSSEKNRDLKFENIPTEATITAEDLHGMLESTDAPFVVDIRAAGLARDAFIEAGKNIPAGRQFDLRISEIPTDSTIVLISSGTSRLAEARQTLIDAGFASEKVLVVGDGMEAWIEAGYPTGHRESMGC